MLVTLPVEAIMFVTMRWLLHCDRYVERFRCAAPLSRDQRQKISATDAAEFWWLHDKDTSSDKSVTQQQPSKQQSMVSSVYSSPGRVQSIGINLSVCLCVCLSASISLEPLDRSAQNFVRRSPVAVAWSSSGGVALRYILPVLWMTSRLPQWAV